MNRRESLKALGITTISAELLLDACKTDRNKSASTTRKNDLEDVTGLQQSEIEKLKKLDSEPAFFNDHERLTLILLADIIIPKDEISGSASDAKVIDFIDFIVKDIPEHQIPMRGGLRWLDMQCLNRYGKSFAGSTTRQQLEMVKEIAYPFNAKAEMHQGVAFFNRMRNLTATGFYTSRIGIKDIGYAGNSPGKWEGVPPDVLAQYNLSED